MQNIQGLCRMTGTDPRAGEMGLIDTITYVGLDVHKATVWRPEVLTKLALQTTELAKLAAAAAFSKREAELEQVAPRRAQGGVASGRGFTRASGFIVTNLARPAERVVAFYNQRGTAGQWIKEGKKAIDGRGCRAAPSPPMRSASSSMPTPTILANLMRTLAMPRTTEA
jgi:hypothetical protein